MEWIDISAIQYIYKYISAFFMIQRRLTKRRKYVKRMESIQMELETIRTASL